MRAAVYERFGEPEVVRIAERPRPTPGRRDVVVRVLAAPVTSADARIRAARYPRGFGPFARVIFGWSRPRRPILGGSFAGTVDEIGAAVTGLTPGQLVCGSTSVALGAHAEYVRVRADRLAPVPGPVSAADAAGVIFGGCTALHFLRELVTLEPGTTLLVNGASGAVGSCAVQLGTRFGAVVTGVCSAANADLVRALGVSATIDHASTDLTALTERFDVVLDTVGTLTLASGRQLLTPGGRLLLAVADLATTLTARGNARAGTAPDRVADVRTLLDWVADGSLRVVLDDELGLDDIVAAHQRVDSGRKVGNLIVRP